MDQFNFGGIFEDWVLPVNVETGLALEEEDRPPPPEGLAELYNAPWRAVRIEGEGLFLPVSSFRLRLDAHMILEVRGEATGLLLLLQLLPAGSSVHLRRMNGDVEPEEEAQDRSGGNPVTRSGASAIRRSASI